MSYSDDEIYEIYEQLVVTKRGFGIILPNQERYGHDFLSYSGEYVKTSWRDRRDTKLSKTWLYEEMSRRMDEERARRYFDRHVASKWGKYADMVVSLREGSSVWIAPPFGTDLVKYGAKLGSGLNGHYRSLGMIRHSVRTLGQGGLVKLSHAGLYPEAHHPLYWPVSTSGKERGHKSLDRLLVLGAYSPRRWFFAPAAT